jgi:hypothetical protein
LAWVWYWDCWNYWAGKLPGICWNILQNIEFSVSSLWKTYCITTLATWNVTFTIKAPLQIYFWAIFLTIKTLSWTVHITYVALHEGWQYSLQAWQPNVGSALQHIVI